MVLEPRGVLDPRENVFVLVGLGGVCSTFFAGLCWGVLEGCTGAGTRGTRGIQRGPVLWDRGGCFMISGLEMYYRFGVSAFWSCIRLSLSQGDRLIFRICHLVREW